MFTETIKKLSVLAPPPKSYVGVYSSGVAADGLLTTSTLFFAVSSSSVLLLLYPVFVHLLFRYCVLLCEYYVT